MTKIMPSLFLILMSCSVAYSGNFRERVFNAPCSPDKFRCLNNICINRGLYCNGVDNCGDNSDEKFCGGDRNECPSLYPFHRCRSNYHYKCIPIFWKCDGIRDCREYGDDEENCVPSEVPNVKDISKARTKAIEWIIKQAENRTTTDRWGPHVRKTAVALYLADTMFSNLPLNFTRKEMAYELSIQLLSKFALKRLKDVPTPELSSFINALLVTCQDPRKFHSVDIVKELRSRVNAQNFTVPYDILSLCNAGEKITRKDVEKLQTAFESKHRTFWTETQAVAVMALACAGKQPGSHFSLNNLPAYTMELKQKQSRNGSIENLRTTAAVMQALFASEPEDDANNFDEEKALQQILREQRDDGSFGSVMNTYYVLPVLNYQSLVNISSDHCTLYIKDEDTGLQELLKLPGKKVRVRYSLWIGDEREMERTMRLKVALNASFYGVMETAGDVDPQFRFQYVVKDGKPYVSAISGIQDDPESGRFWFQYVLNGTKPSPVTISPADVILKDNDHYVMWYQSGSWIK